jgi:CarboxypepD_reg-like domain
MPYLYCMKLVLSIVLLCFSCMVLAQKKTAILTGKVVNENEDGIANVSVVVLGKVNGVTTNDSGFFSIKVPAEKAFALTFSHVGYKEAQQNFLLAEKEKETVTIRLEKSKQSGTAVTVTAQSRTEEVSLVKINPKMAFVIPTPLGGIESLLKVYVGSNNELTSQ